MPDRNNDQRPDQEKTARKDFTENESTEAAQLFKASFQANTREAFEDLMRKSKRLWEKTRVLSDSRGDAAGTKKACLQIRLARFWLQPDPEKRRLEAFSIVDLSDRIVKEVGGDENNEARLETRVDLVKFFPEFINLNADFESLKQTFDKAASVCEQTAGELKKQKPTVALVETLATMVWLLGVEAQVILDPTEFQSLASRTREILSELERASQDVRTPYALCLAKQSAGHVTFNLTGDAAQALAEYESSLKIASTIHDSLLTGRLQWLSCQAAYWRGYNENDPEIKRNLLERGAKYGADSIDSLKIPLQTSELSAAYAAQSTCLIELSNLTGPDLDRKKRLLREAVDTAETGAAIETGTWAWSNAAHSLARALYLLSKLEEPNSRNKLLQESLSERRKIVGARNRLFPQFWTNVTAPYNLALVEFEIGAYEDDPSKKKEWYDQAIGEMEVCIRRGEKWGTNPGFHKRLGEHYEWFGKLLYARSTLTDTPSDAERAINAYQTATAHFIKAESTSSVARLNWTIATVHDDLHDFHRASTEFKIAADNYRKSALEVPGSASHFQDLALYLEAWSTIETARVHHTDGECLAASEAYTTSARTIQETKNWNHLSTLFSARSALEKGEALSSGEKHAEAMDEFKTAINQFREEAKLLEKKLSETTSIDERNSLDKWRDIASQREAYCRGRLELEQARSLDKKGEKTPSAKKYNESAEMFRSLQAETPDVSERTELESLAKFCSAWARMKYAEAKASPRLYEEAADSFLELRSTETRAQLFHLASANASICRALAAGTRFQQTRDNHFYSEVKKHTEAAAEFFREAGFRKTESWTRGTQRLFDAMMFISDAETERNPSRKTELYHTAESQLRLAARLYEEAGFANKRDETLSDLERIREEKQALLTPLETLSQIPTVTAASVTLAPRGRAQPIRTERLDETFVVGDMNLPAREIGLGNELVLDLEIANVGRAPATLLKIQGVVPEGFEPRTGPDSNVSPEGNINLKGRRLEHLQTHQVKIVVRALRELTTELRPRLFYCDDLGNYKTYQFQPTTITALDLGSPSRQLALEPKIVPGKVRVKEEIRFRTERGREVFQHLAKEFLVDYMSKRLYVEKAGWRSLVQIIEDTKIPRSALYGPRGRDGPVLVELERRGLIELRIFPQERGRGGAVKKIRVAYDNSIVKKIVEQSVVDNQKP